MAARLKASMEERLGQGCHGGAEQSRQGITVEAGRVVLQLGGGRM